MLPNQRWVKALCHQQLAAGVVLGHFSCSNCLLLHLLGISCVLCWFWMCGSPCWVLCHREDSRVIFLSVCSRDPRYRIYLVCLFRKHILGPSPSPTASKAVLVAGDLTWMPESLYSLSIWPQLTAWCDDATSQWVRKKPWYTGKTQAFSQTWRGRQDHTILRASVSLSCIDLVNSSSLCESDPQSYLLFKACTKISRLS